MGKFSELDTAIKDLRTAAESIKAVADLLTEMFSEPKPSLETVRAVLADKSRAGHTAEIRALLEKYGGTKLSQIDPANYNALLKDAEVLTDAN